MCSLTKDKSPFLKDLAYIHNKFHREVCSLKI